MSGPATSLADVPLSDVLPIGFAAAERDLRRLTRDLEAHRSATGHVQWHWYPEHKAKPAITAQGVCYLVFDTTITLFNRDNDWFDLTLDVGWCPELTVNAAVEVACWCSHDHNMHQVRESRRPVANSDELVEAFAAGAAMLVGVLDSGRFDPRPWRFEAGLPDAPSGKA
jgi:hypothetical protein